MTKPFAEFMEEYLSQQDEGTRYEAYVKQVMADREKGFDRELMPIESWRVTVSVAMGLIGRMFSHVKVDVK